jgi:hypothetical protein
MGKTISVELLSLVSIVAFVVLLFGPANAAQAPSPPRVNVQIITDEAEAVLRILAKRESGREITDADWQQVFSSEGYVRLKKRELSLQRSFDDEEFKKFTLAEDLARRRQSLAETLAKWRETDVNRIASVPLAYLPPNAQIRARIYPVIKPRDNSFVFDLPDNPAIFLYLDASKSRAVFENEFAHELHHIGYGTACPTKAAQEGIKKLTPNSQRVLRWIGAFGEGFAMLAAAGGANVHPHAASPEADKARWDRDIGNFNNDLKIVEKFFLELSAGKISASDETKMAYAFFGIQGPWYTVGWQMAVAIESTFGRAKLIECFCDQRKLLPTYNKAVKRYNRQQNKQLTPWSKELIRRIKKSS